MKNTMPPPDDDGHPRRGRPTKLTDAVFRGFVELLLSGSYRYVACRNLGVAPKTFRHWLKVGLKFPDSIYGQFRTAVAAAENRAHSNAVAEVLSAGKSDAKFLCWWLERKFPNQWGQYRGELGEVKRQIKELQKVVSATEAADQAAE